MNRDVDDEKIKDAEYLILLILGKAGGSISILHLQKNILSALEISPCCEGSRGVCAPS